MALAFVGSWNSPSAIPTRILLCNLCRLPKEHLSTVAPWIKDNEWMPGREWTPCEGPKFPWNSRGAALVDFRNSPTQIGRANKLMEASQSQTLTFIFFLCYSYATSTQWSGNHWQNYSIPQMNFFGFPICVFMGIWSEINANIFSLFSRVDSTTRQEERPDGINSRGVLH